MIVISQEVEEAIKSSVIIIMTIAVYYSILYIVRDGRAEDLEREKHSDLKK
jgi:hypothetical protein